MCTVLSTSAPSSSEEIRAVPPSASFPGMGRAWERGYATISLVPRCGQGLRMGLGTVWSFTSRRGVATLDKLLALLSRGDG